MRNNNKLISSEKDRKVAHKNQRKIFDEIIT